MSRKIVLVYDNGEKFECETEYKNIVVTKDKILFKDNQNLSGFDLTVSYAKEIHIDDILIIN